MLKMPSSPAAEGRYSAVSFRKTIFAMARVKVSIWRIIQSWVNIGALLSVSRIRDNIRTIVRMGFPSCIDPAYRRWYSVEEIEHKF